MDGPPADGIFRRMIDLDDARWSQMTGGYTTLFDPRPLLRRLEAEDDKTQVWKDLWDELHHQGDIGDASFACVPFLVSSYRREGMIDRNTYALVAIIELARKVGNNPDVPQWLADDVRAILSVLAIQKGLRAHGGFLLNYSEEEMLDIQSRL